MIYVALLRGINVGGNNKVDMKQLKDAFERSGMSAVETYINSGNVIFECEGGKADIAAVLERAIEERFGFFVKVTIRSFEEMSAVIDALPEAWSNDDTLRSDVLFLWEDADAASVLEKMKPGIDTVIDVRSAGAMLWSVARGDATKSGLQKLIGTKVYRQMTVRNVNTTRKLFDLMRARG